MELPVMIAMKLYVLGLMNGLGTEIDLVAARDSFGKTAEAGNTFNNGCVLTAGGAFNATCSILTHPNFP